MYKYLIGFVLTMPLIGIWLVEQGEFAMSVGVPGEPNGATAAFSVYVAVVVITALLTAKNILPVRQAPNSVRLKDHSELIHRQRDYRHFSRTLAWLSTAFLFTMLFGFGGIGVWSGAIEKGLFRATLGPLGGFAYLMTKFALPAAFAYATILYTRSSRNRADRILWYLNIVLLFLAGSTWGFKTTGLAMLLPGLLILNWRLSLRKFLVFTAMFLCVLALLFFWFDAELMEDTDVITFLATRLTVLQGDVAWHVFGLYSSGETLPNYWPTLLAAAGDNVLTAFGLSKSNYMEWRSFHYDWIITNLAGSPLEQIANGHSVTATPFAEGLIAGGWFGILLFAVLGGLLVGRSYYHLDRAIKRGQAMTAAMLSTYFCFHVFAWLNGGAVTQLFHISVLAYIAASYILLSSMRRKTRRRPNESANLALTAYPPLLPSSPP